MSAVNSDTAHAALLNISAMAEILKRYATADGSAPPNPVSLEWLADQLDAEADRGLSALDGLARRAAA